MKYSTYNGYLCIQGISRNTLDLDKTFNCGQCFRWDRLGDGTWKGVVGSSIFMLKHKEINGVESIITTASVEEWKSTLINYLDLNTEYNINIDDNDTFAKQSALSGEGIRILKQDKWESVISFIISQRNNIPKIKSTIRKLCEAFGNKIEIEVNGVVYVEYTFPDRDTIKNLSIQEINSIGLGYRDEYVLNAAMSNIDFEGLDKLNTSSLLERLKLLRGIGEKVANCIALFGYHRLDTFPIDIWIQRVIDAEYNGNLDYTKYGNMCGILQQYMFYYMKYFKNEVR